MAGKGGGAWKVAYADFVTAMMAFFMVMWLVAQSQKTKEAVAGYFKDPYHYMLKKNGGSSMVPGRSNEPNGPSSTLPHGKAGSGAGTDRLKSGVKVQLAGDPESQPNSDTESINDRMNQFVLLQRQTRGNSVSVQFAENSAAMSDTSITHLKRLIPEILGKPNKIEIRGHATHRPIDPSSGFEDNWSMCYARSRNVMRFLIEQGVEAERIRLSQSGPNEPISLSVEDTQQSQNARVEIYLLDEYIRNPRGKTPEKAPAVH
jgi:chemotaxis protein MotB